MFWKASFLLIIFCCRLFAAAAGDLSKQIMTPEKRATFSWGQNLELALKRAQAENSWVLVALLGQEGCPWSEKLEQEYLQARPFVKDLTSDAQLVSLSQQFHKPEFEKFTQAYKVEELPLFLALDGNGQEMFRLGFLPIDPLEFSRQIKLLAKTYRELAEADLCKTFTSCSEELLKDFFLKASQLGNLNFLDTILKIGMQKDQDGFFSFEKYRQLILQGLTAHTETRKLRKKIEAKDPKNEKGLQFKLALLDFEAMQDDDKRNTMQTVLQPLFRYLHRFGKTDTENLWKVELLIAQFLYGKSRTPEALKHLQRSLLAAPDEQKQVIEGTINYLELQLTK